MSKQNSTNTDITINADGFSISGGTTPRELDISGADIAIVGSGSNAYTFPASSCTLRPETTGIVEIWPMKVAPSGWLLCNGAAISRTTYADLFATIVPNLGTATISIATPGVVTLAGHGLVTGDQIYFTTTGTLPTEITTNTLYYVVYINADTFNLSISFDLANAGTKIATSGSSSGTHTLYFCPYGFGDASTTFNVPAITTPVGYTSTTPAFDALGHIGGEVEHTLLAAESGVPAHTHELESQTLQRTSGGSQNLVTTGSYTIGVSSAIANTAADASSAHNNLQPYIVMNYIIKT